MSRRQCDCDWDLDEEGCGGQEHWLPLVWQTDGKESGYRILGCLEGVTHSQQQSHIGSDPRPVPAQSGILEGCEGGNQRASHRNHNPPGTLPEGVGTKEVSPRKEYRIRCCTLFISSITVRWCL